MFLHTFSTHVHTQSLPRPRDATSIDENWTLTERRVRRLERTVLGRYFLSCHTVSFGDYAVHRLLLAKFPAGPLERFVPSILMYTCHTLLHYPHGVNAGCDLAGVAPVVINAVRDFLPHLRYRVVRLMCDNAVTVAYIKNEGGTRSHSLMQMTIRLLKCCDRKAITLVPVHLPGVHNIQADSLSRVGQTLTTEWTMAMERLRPVFAKWGEPQVDLFATFVNRRLIKFASPYPDPRAEWTDAMSMPWDNGRGLLYAFPPFKMVPQVLQKIAQSPGVRVILIAQLQLAASWFPELMDLSQEDPIPLFVEGQDLLTQDVLTGDGVTKTSHFRPSNLHAWKLYGPSWGRRAIPGKLPTWCQGAYGNHHSKCTNPIGEGWHMFRVRSHHFSTYMMHLFRDELLSSTIISHRTSVASVLRHWVYDPAGDSHIKLLIRAFRLERPVQRRIMPKWDLHLVLLSLLRPPFASAGDVDGESSDDVIPLNGGPWNVCSC